MKTDKEKYEEFLAGLEELSLRTGIIIDADVEGRLFIRPYNDSYVTYEIICEYPNWAEIETHM